MRIVNFTHGELYAFGAYIVYSSPLLWGSDSFVAIGSGGSSRRACSAQSSRWCCCGPCCNADIDTAMLVMIGTWIVMQNSRTSDLDGVAKSIVTPFPEAPLVIGPVSVSWYRVFVLLVALALIAASYLLVQHSSSVKPCARRSRTAKLRR